MTDAEARQLQPGDRVRCIEDGRVAIAEGGKHGGLLFVGDTKPRWWRPKWWQLEADYVTEKIAFLEAELSAARAELAALTKGGTP